MTKPTAGCGLKREAASGMRNLNLVGSMVFSVAVSGCVGIGGESIDLVHGDLVAPVRLARGDVSLASPATDARDETSRIGRATMTVFAITSGSIRTSAPLVGSVIVDVGAALETAGYSVQTLEGEPGSGSGRHAQVTIRDFYFRNYNWFWPIVPTWGGVEIDLTLRDTDGAILYERTIVGSGSSLCPLGNCAFTNATSEAWTEVLNELVEVASGTEFERAVQP